VKRPRKDRTSDNLKDIDLGGEYDRLLIRNIITELRKVITRCSKRGAYLGNLKWFRAMCATGISFTTALEKYWLSCPVPKARGQGERTEL
jgi:hypothetical protein